MSLFDKFFGKKAEPKYYQSREGIKVQLHKLLKQLYEKRDPIDTHFSYLNIIGQLYRSRKDPETRELFKQLALEHIEKFDSIRGPLLKDIGMLPHVPTFQHLATVYTEDGEYIKAIEVCEKAIAFGLHDWTKGDYQERIKRIRRKM